MKNISEKIVEVSQTQPEAIAFYESSQSITYSTLEEEHLTFAKFIKELGANNNSIFGVALQKSIDWVIVFSAVVKCNSVIAPIDYNLNSKDLIEVIFNLKVNYLICYPSLLDKLNLNRDQYKIYYLPYLRDEKVILIKFQTIQDRNDLNDIVYLNATSGSSGQIKYGLTSNNNLFINTMGVIESFNLDCTNIHLSLFPSFMHPHEFIYRSVYTGSKSVLFHEFKLDNIIELILKYSVTHLMGTPSQYQSLIWQLKRYNIELKSLKLIESGGGVLSESMINSIEYTFRIKPVIVWGSTETSGIAISSFGLVPKENLLGVPIKSYYVEVFDPETSKQVSSNNKGELVVTGGGVISGYLNSISQFDNSKFANHSFKTSDIVYKNDTGLVYFSSRGEMMIKVAGERVYLGDIESVIKEHPQIAECVVISAKDQLKGEVPLAYIVFKNRIKRISALDLRLYCISRLKHHQIPKKFIFLKQIPRNSYNKIDYKRLSKIRS